MSSLVYTEFDEFEASLSCVQGRYILRSAPRRDWRLRVVDLNGLSLMHGREGAATVYSGIGMAGYFNIFIPLNGQECTAVDGNRFDRRTLGWMVPDRMFHIDASRPASWLTVAISCELVYRWAALHHDEIDVSTLTRNLVITSQTGLAPLLRLAFRILKVDAREPDALRQTVAEHSARSDLLDLALKSVLSVDETVKRSQLHPGHRQLLSRALDLLDAMTDIPVHTVDLCLEAGVSERTLRTIFNRHLGMSPHRYLMLHRLHRIRSALIRAKPGETITEICARYGVWDFGRLAMLYRTHFGVLPSQTLYGRWR